MRIRSRLVCGCGTMSRNLVRNLFKRHLLLTNVVISGSLLGAGDYLQQLMERKSHAHQSKELTNDWSRTARMAGVGLMLGPLCHTWYRFLDRKLPQVTPRTVVKKVGADQLVAAPVLNLTFFLGMGLLEQRSWKECSDELKQKFLYVYLMDWLFWPPVQAINFFWVPPAFRVLYVNVALLLWDVFLSKVKHHYD